MESNTVSTPSQQSKKKSRQRPQLLSQFLRATNPISVNIDEDGFLPTPVLAPPPVLASPQVSWSDPFANDDELVKAVLRKDVAKINFTALLAHQPHVISLLSKRKKLHLGILGNCIPGHLKESVWTHFNLSEEEIFDVIRATLLTEDNKKSHYLGLLRREFDVPQALLEWLCNDLLFNNPGLFALPHILSVIRQFFVGVSRNVLEQLVLKQPMLVLKDVIDPLDLGFEVVKTILRDTPRALPPCNTEFVGWIATEFEQDLQKRTHRLSRRVLEKDPHFAKKKIAAEKYRELFEIALETDPLIAQRVRQDRYVISGYILTPKDCFDYMTQGGPGILDFVPFRYLRIRSGIRRFYQLSSTEIKSTLSIEMHLPIHVQYDSDELYLAFKTWFDAQHRLENHRPWSRYIWGKDEVFEALKASDLKVQ